MTGVTVGVCREEQPPRRYILSLQWGQVDGSGGNETHVETFPHALLT